MKRLSCVLMIIIGMTAGSAMASPKDDAKLGFESQMAAWNRGDLEAALSTYWNSPEMTWVNKSGVQRGFGAFANAMRRDFGNEPASMGHYTGDVLEARDLGPRSALIVVRWSILKDGKQMMGGISTQIWRNVGGRWRAVFEHAS